MIFNILLVIPMFFVIIFIADFNVFFSENNLVEYFIEIFIRYDRFFFPIVVFFFLIVCFFIFFFLLLLFFSILQLIFCIFEILPYITRFSLIFNVYCLVFNLLLFLFLFLFPHVIRYFFLPICCFLLSSNYNLSSPPIILTPILRTILLLILITAFISTRKIFLRVFLKSIKNILFRYFSFRIFLPITFFLFRLITVN